MSQKFNFILVLLIFPFSQQSNASLIPMSRKLSEGDNSKEKNIQIPPWISPVSSVNFNPAGAPVDNFVEKRSQNVQAPANSPKAQPIGTITNERCGLPSNSCKDDENNMTACLSYAGNGPKVPFLIVQNDGENSLEVKFTRFPINDTVEGLELSKHQAKKINIPANLGGIKSIVFSAGNAGCTIQIGSSAPENNFYKHFHYYATNVTPMHGAYLLFFTAIVIGGIWACCKLGTGERHLEGVPYQELEMGQPGSLSAMNVETGEGWDEGWDDDWDEEKAVKSPGGNRVRNGRANGRASRSSDNDGLGNDWDD